MKCATVVTLVECHQKATTVIKHVFNKVMVHAITVNVNNSHGLGSALQKGKSPNNFFSLSLNRGIKAFIDGQKN